LKCKAQYQDTDVDAYYCETCNIERKRIALEIDKKIGLNPKKPVVSAMQAYENAPKIRGFANAKYFL